ncbi:MAG: alpha/beta hydrolase, partial [Candidatus Gracilibacteria bacterium]|nr:alpha/beta hydrolase [Candidatus Gracilibacteria bacterium]
SRFSLSPRIFGIPIQRYFFHKDSFQTLDYIKNITQPILLIHGNQDLQIPFFHSENIYKNFAYPDTKFLLELDDQGHNGIISKNGIALYGQIGNFLDTGKLFHHDNRIKYTLDEKENWEAGSKLWSILQVIDLQSDDSIQKFVTSDLPFIDKKYIPEELVGFGNTYVKDGKGNGRLRPEVTENVHKMGEA